MSRIFLFGLLLLTVFAELLGQNAHHSLRSGDQAYDQENYTEAQEHYQEAVRQNPASLHAIYNLGCAEYRQGKYPEAEKSFEKAASGNQQSNNKADVLYNLGNARLKQRKYRDAIDAYQQSLRLHPGDAATKENLQLAKQKLQEQQQREQKKLPQEQQKSDNQPPPQEQPSSAKTQQPPGKQNQAPGQPPEKSGEQPAKGQESPAAMAPGKITRQEAQRLLESTIGPEDRKSARKYRTTVQQEATPKASKKDW